METRPWELRAIVTKLNDLQNVPSLTPLFHEPQKGPPSFNHFTSRESVWEGGSPSSTGAADGRGSRFIGRQRLRAAQIEEC
jgi:hypothetical protein